MNPPAPWYSPHPQPAPHAYAGSAYKGHATLHRGTQQAAEASKLIAPARLFTAKDDLYLRMAAFSSALGILSALRAAQTGDQVANVLIANAARCGAEGPAVAPALADGVAYLEAGDFLTLVGGRDRRPPGGPLGDRDRGQRLGGNVIAARLGQIGNRACARSNGAPSCGLGAGSGGSVHASGTPADGPATPPIPARPLPPPSVVPYPLADSPTSGPLACVDFPRPTPATSPLPAPAPLRLAAAPCKAAYAPLPPPEAQMGSPASRQLVEVTGLNPDTMTIAALRDALRGNLGSTKFVVQPCLQRRYESVPSFEAVWRAIAGDQTRALMPVMAAAR